MAERLTECIDSHLLDNGEMVKEYYLNKNIKLNEFSVMDVPNAIYDKLGMLEDIMEEYGMVDIQDFKDCLESMYDESINAKTLKKFKDIMAKYGIESAEELDNLIANYRTSPLLTEERIKEIAINEQRKVLQPMIKEITEKECNQLYTELNTWKKACELACEREDDCYVYDNIHRAYEFYQQAKTEGNDE